MKNTYVVSEKDLRDAVNSATRKIMRGQKGWKKDQKMMALEFVVEKGITEKIKEVYGLTIEFI